MDYWQRYKKYINQNNPFMTHNNIEIIEAEPDRAVAELTVCGDNLNPVGTLHGGAYFTMADCVSGTAARSNGMKYVTLNSSFEFIRSIKKGTIRATARVRRRGRTICLTAVEVTDQEGRLLAEGKFTMFCLGEPAKID